MATTLKLSNDLLRLRELWRGDSDSCGYQHSSLIYAACKLLKPPPKTWEAKSLWLVFYSETELPSSADEVDFHTVRIFREGYSLYERYGKDD